MTQIQDIFDAESVNLADEFVCGFVDPESGKVHTDFIVEAMGGEAEDVINGKGPRIPIFNRFIGLCMQTIGPYSDKATIARAIEEMPSLDRMISLIAIRRATHGDIYNMIVNMPDDCEKETQRFKVNLKTLARTPMRDPAVRKRNDSLWIDTAKGRAEYKAHWHIMVGRDEMWAGKVLAKTNSESERTVQILTRLDGITRVGVDGAADIHLEIERGDILSAAKDVSSQLRKSIQVVQSFPATLRRQIHTLFDDIEGDIDVTLEFDYKTDEGEEDSFKTLLDPTQKEFFFPRATSDSSKTTYSIYPNSGA